MANISKRIADLETKVTGGNDADTAMQTAVSNLSPEELDQLNTNLLCAMNRPSEPAAAAAWDRATAGAMASLSPADYDALMAWAKRD